MPIVFQLEMLMPRPTTTIPGTPVPVSIEPLVHLLQFFFSLSSFSRSKFAGACAFSILSPSPFFLPPPPSSSSSRPRRRASYCRRRRPALPRHNSASWPPRPTPGGSFSLIPAARRPSRLLQQTRGPTLLHNAASRRLARPFLSTSLRRRKFGLAPPSSLRCSG